MMKILTHHVILSWINFIPWLGSRFKSNNSFVNGTVGSPAMSPWTICRDFPNKISEESQKILCPVETNEGQFYGLSECPQRIEPLLTTAVTGSLVHHFFHDCFLDYL